MTNYDANIAASSDDTDDDGSMDSEVQGTSNDTHMDALSEDASDDNCSMDSKVWYWWKGWLYSYDSNTMFRDVEDLKRIEHPYVDHHTLTKGLF